MATIRIPAIRVHQVHEFFDQIPHLYQLQHQA